MSFEATRSFQNDMKWIETAITYLFPAVLLEGKPWRHMWEEKEREVFVLICRFFFLTTGVLYLGHYFFYDKVMGLEPLQNWFIFRMVATGSGLVAFLFYMSPLAQTRFYKIPAILATWVYCFTQAMIVTWWDGTPWLYSYVFVLICVIVVRTTPVFSALLAAIFMASQTSFLLEVGVPLTSIISTAVLFLFVLVIIRSSHITDIRNFVLNQENVSAQKEIIELNIEFADRLRAFIPKVIARRLDDYINQNRLTILQAVVEVLKARQTKVACLFSDIRGYTQGSKELESFVSNSVLPEMKACSDLVEVYEGIPRKVGDLIFAYFDDENFQRNIIHALMAGMEIARLNQDMNATVTETEIRRYILLSSGEAIVGNLGGLDSSIEITALGSPVNFLSRLDDLTKEPAISKILNPGDIIVCESTLTTLRKLGVELRSEVIDLHALNLTVRDFPETQTVHRIEPTDSNYRIAESAYRCMTPATHPGSSYDKHVSGQI